DIRIVLRYRLGPGLSLQAWNFIPEMIEHGVDRRVPIVPSAMHLASGDHVDAGDFLIEYGCLCGTQLRIGQIAVCELSQGDKPIESLIPAWDTVCADHRGCIPRIERHLPPLT